MWFLEHTTNRFHTAKLIPREDIKGLTGFRTIPCYDPDVKKLIEANGNMKGLEDSPVMVDTLFLDFDNGESDSLDKTKRKMQKAGIGYELYFSGKKGYHLECKLVPLYGRFIMPKIKFFVEHNLALSKAEVDHTIYHNCGLIRLEGTIHDDTGKPKILVDSHTGSLLEIDVIASEKIYKNEADLDKFQIALQRIANSCEGEIGSGERHVLLYSIGRNLLEAGVSQETASELLLQLNKRFNPPKEEDELLHQVRRLYKS